MGVSFAQPWFLLLLIPGALLLAARSGKRRFPQSSRPLILGVRMLIILLLVLALAQPHLVLKVKGRSIVYLLDQSRSVEEDYSSWIGESLKAMDSRDRAAVLGFGRDTSLLKPFSMDQLPTLASSVDDEFTDLEGALESAYSLLPGSGGRLVLISDGLENIGDAMRIGEMLAAAGIPVDVVPIPAQAKLDAAVCNISLPKNTWPGQQVVAEVTVEATAATTAELTVFFGGNLAWRQQLEISPGVQSFSVPLSVGGQGLQRVRATIDPVADTQVRNNSIEGLTFVQSPPRILVVEGVAGKGAALKTALEGAGLEADIVGVTEANLDPVALAGYRGIILVDLPAYKLEEKEISSLETFVRVLGGGLVAVGGKSSFGPGLYEDTLLEAMLPVKMAVEDKEEMPGLDMVLVIDRSGSMTGEKLNMAKNAAIQALELLKEDDRLGVVTFDSAYKVELPLTSLTNKDDITNVIASIGSGGGTAIYPGLAQGVAMLGGGEKVKHIILLSDGQDGMTYSYDALLEEAEAKGITISTIALGEGADLSLMESLAAKGNGRSYIVTQGQDLPAVFLQETALAGGEWLMEEDFVPSLLHPDTLAIAGNTPLFHGYVASTAKPLAEVLLTTHRDHPLLSRWQYGLGRTAAFTSDTFGMWSREFLAHPGFASLWLDIVNWTVPTGQGSDIALESRLAGAGAEISALLGTPLEEGEQLAVTLVDAEGKTQVLELLPAGGGRYAAGLEHIAQGVYLISASRLKEGKVSSHAQGGFAVPYPAEFGINNYSGEDLLKALAESTGGRVLTKPAEVFSIGKAVSRRLTDITWWLLLAAIILWPADIALRRLGGLPPPKAKKAAKTPRKTQEEPRDETMERLLAAKRRRR
jgi:Mg-chelatase subunit ChlD